MFRSKFLELFKLFSSSAISLWDFRWCGMCCLFCYQIFFRFQEVLIAWILLKCKRRNLHEFRTPRTRLYCIQFPILPEKKSWLNRFPPFCVCFVGEILSPIRVSKFGKTVCVHLAPENSLFPPFWALENLTGAGAYCSFIYLNGGYRGFFKPFFPFFKRDHVSMLFLRRSLPRTRELWTQQIRVFKSNIQTGNPDILGQKWEKRAKTSLNSSIFSPDQSAIMTVSERGKE